MRKGIGIILLILGWIAMYILEFMEPVIHGHVFPKNVTAADIGSVVVWIWFFLSTLVKSSMTFNKKMPALNAASLLAYILTVILAILAGPSGNVYSLPQNVAGIFLVVGWPTVDLIDLLSPFTYSEPDF